VRKGKKFAEGGGTDYNTTDYASSGSAGGTNISFGEAFRAARKQGLKNFSWKGKSYNTKTKEDAAPKKAETPAPKKADPLEEVTVSSSRKKAETSAPKKAEPMQEVTVSASRPKKSSFGANFANTGGFQVADAEDGMSTKERRAALGNVAVGAASLLPAGRLARGVGAAGKAASLGERGFTMAERERSAAAAAKAAEKIKNLKSTAQARARMSPGSVYKSGGSVKKYNSGGSVRGKGCEVKGIGKGRMR
jgi:hypothetical protein